MGNIRGRGRVSTYDITVELDANTVTANRVIGDRASGVVVGGLEAVVGLLDNVKNTVTSRALALDGRDRPIRLILGVVIVRKGTGVGLVKVKVAGVDLPVDVASLLSNQLEEVGTTIPASEGGKTPVSGQRGNDRVVSVEGVVSSALQVFGDGTTKQNAVDTVGGGVGARLIKGNEDQSILGEVFVLQQRGQEAVHPLTRNVDVAVVGIIGHVGGDEEVLGQAVVLQILVECGKVLDLARTNSVVGDRVEQNQWVVLAHVLVGAGQRVAVTLVARMGHVLLVFTPGDLLGVEQIGNGGDIGGNLVEVIVVHTEGVTSSGGTIVGLRGVGHGVVVGEQDTLLGQLGPVRIASSGIEVLWESISIGMFGV